jgi:hypothetical protein
VWQAVQTEIASLMLAMTTGTGERHEIHKGGSLATASPPTNRSYGGRAQQAAPLRSSVGGTSVWNAFVETPRWGVSVQRVEVGIVLKHEPKRVRRGEPCVRPCLKGRHEGLPLRLRSDAMS